MRTPSVWTGLAAVWLGLFATGCVPISGVASLSVLTRSNGQKVKFEPIGGRVEKSECFYNALLFVWGDSLATHESVVERVLDETGADVLLDAQFYNEQYGFPLIFQMGCATVEGQPAKVVPR